MALNPFLAGVVMVALLTSSFGFVTSKEIPDNTSSYLKCNNKYEYLGVKNIHQMCLNCAKLCAPGNHYLDTEDCRTMCPNFKEDDFLPPSADGPTQLSVTTTTEVSSQPNVKNKTEYATFPCDCKDGLHNVDEFYLSTLVKILIGLIIGLVIIIGVLLVLLYLACTGRYSLIPDNEAIGFNNNSKTNLTFINPDTALSQENKTSVGPGSMHGVTSKSPGSGMRPEAKTRPENTKNGHLHNHEDKTRIASDNMNEPPSNIDSVSIKRLENAKQSPVHSNGDKTIVEPGNMKEMSTNMTGLLPGSNTGLKTGIASNSMDETLSQVDSPEFELLTVSNTRPETAKHQSSSKENPAVEYDSTNSCKGTAAISHNVHYNEKAEDLPVGAQAGQGVCLTCGQQVPQQVPQPRQQMGPQQNQRLPQGPKHHGVQEDSAMNIEPQNPSDDNKGKDMAIGSLDNGTGLDRNRSSCGYNPQLQLRQQHQEPAQDGVQPSSVCNVTSRNPSTTDKENNPYTKFDSPTGINLEEDRATLRKCLDN